MKQTAVEWFVDQLSYTTTDGNIISYHKNITHLFEQAKEIEKEQMKESYNEALYQDVDNTELLEFEQYYNKTFKSE